MVGVPLAGTLAGSAHEDGPGTLKNEQISMCGENYASGRCIHEFKWSLTEVVTPVMLALEADVHCQNAEGCYMAKKGVSYLA